MKNFYKVLHTNRIFCKKISEFINSHYNTNMNSQLTFIDKRSNKLNTFAHTKLEVLILYQLIGIIALC